MDGAPKPSSSLAEREKFIVRKALAGIPGFPSERIAAARLKRLFGLTNRVFAVEVDGRRYCLRLPGAGTSAIIDRRVEETNARRAAAAGVAPEVLYFGADGVMLTAFVEDAAPLTREALSERAGAIERVAAVLRKLHDQAEPFARTYDPFGTMETYLDLLGGVTSLPLPGARASVASVQAIRGMLASRPVKPKSCHCDPTGRNLLDDGERVWLVDWEYSGQNDPAWDLAYFSIESALDAAGDLRLLTRYHGRAPTTVETARVEVTKPVCEVLAAVWALVQAAQGNRVADFETYAQETLVSAAERMASVEFAEQMRALREA
jgi:thiamine kinase-like enzyme